jgi:hypothetical protein
MYATAQALMMLALAAMIAILARKHWFAAEAPADLNGHGYVRSLLGVTTFLVSVPAYLLIGQWAFAIWAVGPILGGYLLRSSGVLTHR